MAEELGGRGPTATRRDVVRAWCGTLDRGAPVAQVEEASERLLDAMSPTTAHAERAEGRGVAERRHVVTGRELGAERGELARLLARRGMHMPGAPGLERAQERGRDVGIGFG